LLRYGAQGGTFDAKKTVYRHAQVSANESASQSRPSKKARHIGQNCIQDDSDQPKEDVDVPDHPSESHLGMNHSMPGSTSRVQAQSRSGSPPCAFDHDHNDAAQISDSGSAADIPSSDSDCTHESGSDSGDGMSSEDIDGTSTSESESESDCDGDGDDDNSDWEEKEKYLAFDPVDERLLLYTGSHVTVKDFATVLETLQTTGEPKSDNTMKQFLAVVKSILPPDHTLTDQETLRKLLSTSVPSVKRVHGCSNHCVLFIGDLESADRCPKCARMRFHVSSDGKKQPVNVFRYVPLEEQMRVIFSNPESAQQMRLDPTKSVRGDDIEVTDITESPGFRQKVIDSNFLTDVRNPVFMLAVDGVNPNGRKSRASKPSMWPYLLTLANKPRDIRHKRENVILAGLVAGHVIVDGKKKYGAPTSLNIYTEFILRAISNLNGIEVRDSSYHVLDPKAHLKLSVLLLGTVSDLDGLYKLLNMVGAGGKRCCPKCTISGKYYRYNFF